jgi:hypothetical protein
LGFWGWGLGVGGWGLGVGGWGLGVGGWRLGVGGGGLGVGGWGQGFRLWGEGCDRPDDEPEREDIARCRGLRRVHAFTNVPGFIPGQRRISI